MINSSHRCTQIDTDFKLIPKNPYSLEKRRDVCFQLTLMVFIEPYPPLFFKREGDYRG